ncbi:MAG: cytochrome c3 family protein [Steroidobacterales bacterium]
MAQVFQPRLVLLLKLGALAGLALVAVAILAWRISIAPHPSIGSPVEQAVPFSHKHHVGDVGLDCRYCHASVERSAFAGLPSTHTCMTCHSQLFTDSPMLAPVVGSFESGKPLQWTRVHDLPDFVYFNHSIHIAKGIGCASCHGAVDRMPLTWRTASLEMQWCLGCHRAPEPYVRPRERVFDLNWHPAGSQLELGKALVRRYHIHTASLTDCSICHR